MNSIPNSSFPIDLAALSTLPRTKQRRLIGQYFYPKIYNIHPNLMPHKLTDILLDINSISALISMIGDPALFHVKLREAVQVLQTYYAMSNYEQL